MSNTSRLNSSYHSQLPISHWLCLPGLGRAYTVEWCLSAWKIKSCTFWLNFCTIIVYFHSKPDESGTNIGKILPGRPLWLHIWFVCRNWVGQGAHLSINLDADWGRELVPLFGRGVQWTKPQLNLQGRAGVKSDGIFCRHLRKRSEVNRWENLVQVVQLASHPDVPVAGNISRLQVISLLKDFPNWGCLWMIPGWDWEGTEIAPPGTWNYPGLRGQSAAATLHGCHRRAVALASHWQAGGRGFAAQMGLGKGCTMRGEMKGVRRRCTFVKSS